MGLSLKADRQSLTVGEACRLYVSSTSSVAVSISCFYETPPPPGFGGCDACRIHYFPEGNHEFSIPITRFAWADRRGWLDADARNQVGERELVHLAVNNPRMRR